LLVSGQRFSQPDANPPLLLYWQYKPRLLTIRRRAVILRIHCAMANRLSSRTNLTAISLYTGVGGLDFGFEAAGFRTAAAVEMDTVACRALRLNRRWPVIEGDIHGVESEQILQIAGLSVGEADVLIGGPPCQPFSKSGYWLSGDARRLDDPRSNTLTAFLRVLRDTRPRSFLLENVPGLAFSGKDEGLQALLEGVDEVNRQAGTSYNVHWSVLNAADYGVPQLRQRVFLVGSRTGSPFAFPKPSFFPEDACPVGQQTHRTAWDAIGDLEPDIADPCLVVAGKWGALLPSIPEGQNYLWHTPRGGGQPLFGWRTRYWSFLLKLAKNRPSWTIQAQPGTAIGPFHWRNRRLSAHEMCRLQTFPDGLRFECSRHEVQRLVGNAVPSLLTEILAGEIREQLLGLARRPRKPSLLPIVRTPVPRSEQLATVPREYARYLGDHADHPGEGLGRGASRRMNSERVSAASRKSADEAA
jgi:DNA (cytosine-5)-methyltransferase 1